MSSAQVPQLKSVVFEGVTPILRVASASASIRYYVDVLGFELEWQYPEGLSTYFACVARGRCRIFLSQDDQGHPGTWVWVGVDDVEALLKEYRQTGAKIRHPPTNYDWALEMQVEDLDGNILRMASDTKKTEPVGEWLDMDGNRWLPHEGGWKKVE